jgi:ACS family hexuronate transporter-like MFS transporter
MGIINGGTAIGGIIAPPLIALILRHVGWLHFSSWRWVFFITGTFGIIWVVWWLCVYHVPVETIENGRDLYAETCERIPLSQILSYRQTWGIVIAKTFSDAAWYFYLFWLPKYLYDARGFDIKAVGSVAWIPHAAAGIGCLCGGTLSSYLLARQLPVDLARKLALGASAAMMPLLILVPHVGVVWAIVLFCVGYFGQQSWSTLVMVLPTDLFPRQVVGTVAGLVGLGGALGGIAFGQLAGFLLDRGFGYSPVFAIAGTLHVAAFVVILVGVPRIRRLDWTPELATQGIA